MGKKEISNETYIELITILSELKDEAIKRQYSYITIDENELSSAKCDLAEGYLAGIGKAIKVIEKKLKGFYVDE